jgi:hypothetical protein
LRSRANIAGISDARSLIALATCWLLIVPQTLPGQVGAPPPMLRIEILDGDDAINNIRQRTAREVIVEVQDENHKPVSGALVIFSAKGGSPFGRTVLKATTDSSGRVSANPLQLKSKAGRLEIKVKASAQGRSATRVIHQTNSETGGQAGAATATAAVAAVPVVIAVPMTTRVFIGVAAAAVTAAVVTLVVVGGGGKTTTIAIGTPRFP